jgi:hypothetical protein
MFNGDKNLLSWYSPESHCHWRQIEGICGGFKNLQNDFSISITPCKMEISNDTPSSTETKLFMAVSIPLSVIFILTVIFFRFQKKESGRGTKDR